MSDDPTTKALRNLVIFHDPDHPDHAALHEGWIEDCLGNDVIPTTAGLRDSLLRGAERALESPTP